MTGPKGNVDRKQLLFARGLTLGIGLLCTFFAWAAANYMETHQGKFDVIDLLPRFNMFRSVACFSSACFCREPERITAIISIGVALMISGIWTWWVEILGVFYWLRVRISGVTNAPAFADWYFATFGTNAPLSISWATSLPCIVGFLTAWVLSYVLENGGDHPGRAYTWREVMKRPAPSQADRPENAAP